MEFVEAGGYRDRRVVARRRLGLGVGGISECTRRSGNARGSAGTGAGCSNACRCRRAGRSTSPRPKRARLRAWRGLRLPTEAEFHRAAYRHARRSASASIRGATPLRRSHRVTSTSRAGIPSRSASHPRGRERIRRSRSRRQRLGVDVDGVRPVPRLRAMPSYPEYSADFFDGEHFVMKGASPVTARELAPPRFRNWFRPRYPYVYATFRCVGRRRDACDLSHAARPRAACSPRRSADSCTRHAAPAAVELFLRRARLGALRRHLPSCRGTGSRAPSRRCSTATRARSWRRSPRRSRSPSSGAATATSWRC